MYVGRLDNLGNRNRARPLGILRELRIHRASIRRFAWRNKSAVLELLKAEHRCDGCRRGGVGNRSGALALSGLGVAGGPWVSLDVDLHDPHCVVQQLLEPFR